MLDFSRPVIALAPLAGFTDLPFRSVAKKLGADLTVSEMISANALAHGSGKSEKMLTKSALESPYAIQIAGSEPGIIKKAVEVINRCDGVDIIDLNCGCPVPKVVNNLQGSALLTDLKKMSAAIETIRKYSKKPYLSVKIRLGFSEKNHVNIAKVCEDAGADFITVHGRTRSGRFKSEVDYDAIGEVRQAVHIPVMANGDINTYEKARQVMDHTGCEGVMIGRAAIGRPWIFRQIKEKNDEISQDTVRAAVLEHFDQMINHYGEYGVILFRKHLHVYSKTGFYGAAAFRKRINSITEAEIMREEIVSFFQAENYI